MSQSLRKMQTVKELREAAGLTQAELAYRAAVSQTTIANWEQYRSSPAIDQWRRVASVLGVRMDRIATSPYERLLHAHDVWYHLKASQEDEGEWVAKAIGVDWSEQVEPGDRFGTSREPRKPLDERDPETTSVVVPVTWKWESRGKSPDSAIQFLADRISRSLDRAYAP
jgi:transcriptional regulator with XRE-family HTH domain